MHLDFDITIRFLDVFILGYFVYMYWIGSKQGAIVRAVDLFAFSGGILLSSLFTRIAYKYFENNRASHPELFAALLLALMFSASLWFAYTIQKTVFNQTKNIEKGKKDGIIGGILSLIKAVLVSGIFTLILLSLNVSGKFLPKEEPQSALGYITSSIVALTVRNYIPLYYKIYYSKIQKKKQQKQQKTPQQPQQPQQPPLPTPSQQQQQQQQIPIIQQRKPTDDNF